MHNLLQNQLRRHLKDVTEPTPQMAAFLQAVNEAYKQSDADRILLERSLELTSLELIERNAEHRRRAEAALDESYSLLSATLESAADGILAVNLEGRVVNWNRKFLGMWQLPESLKTLSGDDLMLELMLDQLSNPVQFRSLIEDLRVRPDAESSDDLEFKDGRVFERVSKPQRINGACVGRVWNFRNITEHRLAEEQLLRAKRLETAGQLAGQIAHDFNNLLSPLVAYPELLRMWIPPDERVIRVLDEMEDATKQIVEINQQLLTLGRRGHYNQEAINLNQVVGTALRTIAPSPTLTICLKLSPDLMPAKGGAAQIVRMLTNLMTNAIDAMNGAGILTVETQAVYLDLPLRGYNTVVAGEYLRVDVSDTGAGIPADVVGRIFEPFFTTKTTDSKRGSGLGLSVVHAVIEDHGGYLDVVTAPGKGTTFSVFLPVDHSTRLHQSTDSSLPRGNGERVLVADDDPMQLNVMQTVLRNLGYSVTTVLSGEAAVISAREQANDVIIVDMVMGGIDGAETIRQILTHSPEQSVIILSGFAQGERVEAALGFGAKKFLPKPLQVPALAHTLAAVLQQHAMESVSQ